MDDYVDIFIVIHAGRVICVGNSSNDESIAWEKVLDPKTTDHKYTFEWWRRNEYGHIDKFASIENDATEFVSKFDPNTRYCLWGCRTRGFAGLPETNFTLAPGRSWAELDRRELNISALWPRDHVLRRILEGKTNVKLEVCETVNIQSLLELTEITTMTCRGGYSGTDFSYHCEKIVDPDIITNTWMMNGVRDRPPACVRGRDDTIVLDAFITVITSVYAKTPINLDAVSLKNVNMVFNINGKWRIQVKFDMIKKIADDDNNTSIKMYVPPNDDSAVRVRVSDATTQIS